MLIEVNLTSGMELKKTHYIVFDNKTIDGHISVHIENKLIDRVYEKRCWGVYIDSIINWIYHIEKRRKFSKSICIGIILYKASNGFYSHNVYVIHGSKIFFILFIN